MKENCNGESIAVLLLYPDTLKAALGSPGFRQVFRTLDNTGDIQIDRGWYDKKNESIVYESRKWKGKYDLIAFSVPYELLYSNVVRCLSNLSVEPERDKRNDKEPLIFIGGAAPTINPAVASAIADVVYIGEAENHIIDAVRQAVVKIKTRAARKLTPMSGKKLPEEKSAAPRFIIPGKQIDSSYIEGFDRPSLSTFRGAGLVEVGRGCSRGCRFCAAGHIYLPTRHRSVEDIIRDVETYKGKAERIGLVGASVSDHRYLKEVIKGILDRGFGLTTSSMRADMLDYELVSLLKKSGLKTVTIAPEGGNERIRKIVNKNLTEEDILKAVSACSSAGIKKIRLYYMVGLPWEKETDLDAIPVLTGKILSEFKRPGSRITVSVNPFIPKPQTPFQWCGMAEPSYIKKAYSKLKHAFLKMPGVTLKTLSMRVALREAVISLGDEAVGRAIISNARDGVPWKKALSINGVDAANLIHRVKNPDESFPWDDVTYKKTKAALLTSLNKARCAAE